MKRLLFLLPLLLILLLSPALAEPPATWVDGNYQYHLTDEGAVLTGYLITPGSIGVDTLAVLPAEIAGHPVIGYDFVFSSLAPSERIIVHEGVTNFGNAFCESWFDCEIVLPASLEHIEESSLRWVQAEIAVHPDNPHFTCEDGFLIDTRTQTLLYTAPSAAEKPLPAVKRLGDSCLDNWHASEAVILPETLTSIGAYVFSDCVDVTGMELPAGVTEIGAGAFNCCTLTEITLPAGLTAIEYLTFSCNSFTEVILPEGVQCIESWAFYLVPLKSVEIPASCTFVAWDAFDPEVTLVLLGENTHVETEEEYMIRMWDDEKAAPVLRTGDTWEYILTDDGAVITNWICNDFTEDVPNLVELPAMLDGQPVVGVAYNALNTSNMSGEISCTFLFPEGLQWLEEGALTCCHHADRLILPASLVSIPEGFSSHMYAEITLSEDNPRYILQDGYLIDMETDTLIYTSPNASREIPAVRRIGSGALDNYGMGAIPEGAPRLFKLVIPEGVEVLGSWLAYDSIIFSVTLPESLRVIETCAFECVEVESGVIVVPAGVEMIEYGAFGLYSPQCTEIIVMSPDTHIETVQEYLRRTNTPDLWILEETFPLEYTPGWM